MMQKYGEEIKATTKGKNDYHAFVLSCFVSATPVALLVRLQRHKLVGSTELSLQGPVLATQRIHNILAPCNTDPLPHPSFRHLHLLADPGHHRLLPRGPEWSPIGIAWPYSSRSWIDLSPLWPSEWVARSLRKARWYRQPYRWELGVA